MELRLRESLRETLGSTYDVSVSVGLVAYPARRFLTQVSFGCEPGRAEELTRSVTGAIAALQGGAVTDAELTKLRETFSRSREKEKETNPFWHRTLTRSVSRGQASVDPGDEAAVLRHLTADTLARLVRLYFPLDNYLTGYLLPE
jgi:zinc protease